jgi:hypothetical protein
MKHRLLDRACLLTLIVPALCAGCAEGTQGPASDFELGQAGKAANQAGAAGSSFQSAAANGSSGAGESANATGGGVAGTESAANGGAASVISGGAPASAGNGSAGAAAGGAAGFGMASSGTGGESASSSCAPHTFSYPDSAHTLSSVGVSGTFNGWAMTGVPLSYDAASQSWLLAMSLAAGSYQYKFVLNGSEWKTDPNDSNSTGDGFGGLNSVIACP